MKKISHPGIELQKILKEKGISQSDFAIKIGTALPLLNNFIKGNRNFNIGFALSLEMAEIESADYWMEKQVKFLLSSAREDSNIKLKEIWKKIGELVPTPFFFKEGVIKNNLKTDINKIFSIYNVKDIKSLNKRIETFPFRHFRRSSAFQETKINTVGWSLLAEYKASKLKAKAFDTKNEQSIIKELNKGFYKGKNVRKKTEAILSNYGIKFFILDRPPKTPVDGKSFISNENPAIVLSLKYKRLDNFAFNVMHELGHIFKHLIQDKYQNDSFYTNNSNNDIEEFEANSYARNKLIEEEHWDRFILTNTEFTDDAIYSFSKKIKIHPAIIRGRVCFEYPENYKKRSSINIINKIDLQ